MTTYWWQWKDADQEQHDAFAALARYVEDVLAYGRRLGLRRTLFEPESRFREAFHRLGVELPERQEAPRGLLAELTPERATQEFLRDPERFRERLRTEARAGLITEPSPLPARATAADIARVSLSGRSFLESITPFLAGSERRVDTARFPGPLRAATEVGLAPVTWATALAGGPAAAGLRTLGPAGRTLAPLVEPVIRGGPLARLGAETAVGTAGLIAGEETARRVPAAAPAPVRVAATLGAGVAAGGLTAGGIAGARSGLRRLAEVSPVAARQVLERNRIRPPALEEAIQPLTQLGPAATLPGGRRRPVQRAPLAPAVAQASPEVAATAAPVPVAEAVPVVEAAPVPAASVPSVARIQRRIKVKKAEAEEIQRRIAAGETTLEAEWAARAAAPGTTAPGTAAPGTTAVPGAAPTVREAPALSTVSEPPVTRAQITETGEVAAAPTVVTERELPGVAQPPGEMMVLRGAFEIVPGQVERELATISKAKSGPRAIRRAELEEMQVIYRTLRDFEDDPVQALDELLARLEKWRNETNIRAAGPMGNRLVHTVERLPEARGLPRPQMLARVNLLERWLSNARVEPVEGRLAMFRPSPEPVRPAQGVEPLPQAAPGLRERLLQTAEQRIPGFAEAEIRLRGLEKPRGGVMPADPLGRVEAMWQAAGMPRRRSFSDLRLQAEEWINDIYSGLRQMQRRAEKRARQPITPGSERDLISLLTRGPGAASAGATRYQLAVKEMGRVAPDIDADHINTFIFANHAKEIFAQHPDRQAVGFLASAAEADTALRQLEARLGPERYRRVEAAAKIVQRLYQDERQRLVAAGFITPEEARVWEQQYPWYNPLRYMQFVDEQTAQGKVARPFTVMGRGVYRLSDEGVEAIAQPPLEVLADQLIRNEVRIQQNETAKAIIRLAQEAGEPVGKVVDIRPVAVVEEQTIFRPVTEVGPGRLAYFENGERQVYEVPDWIYREAVTLNRAIQNPVSSLVGAVNGISRAAFTTFSPPFVVSNMVIDMLTAFLTRGLLPHQTVIRLLASLRGLEHDPVMQTFRLAGGYQMRFFGRSAQQLAKEAGASGGKIIGHGQPIIKHILDAIPIMGERVEQAPRMALFARQMDKTLPGWRQMAPEVVARTPQARKAVAEAVEVTINFSRGGYLIKAANPYILFLNAAMEGIKLPFRALRDNPAARLRLAGVGAGLVGLTAYNMSYPEYFDVPNEYRWGSVIVMLPSKEKDAQGNPKPNYVTIVPRTREWALFFAPIVYAMEKMFTDSPTDFGTFTKAVAVQTLPVDPTSPLPIPEVLAEMYEQKANWDYYWNQPIVPTELQSRPATEQVMPWTSRTLQFIGEKVGLSPIRLQHAVTGLLGGAGSTATSVADYIVELIAPREVDPEVALLVRQYEALPDPMQRRALLSETPPELREALLRELRQPEQQMPVVSAIARRFMPDRSGQLRRTAEQIAARQTGISPKQTQQVGERLQRVTDALLTQQQQIDAALTQGQITPQQWREARGNLGVQYEGALLTLGIEFPGAAQVQADPERADAYYRSVATVAGSTADRRTRAQILAAGWYVIPLEETVPGSPDWNTFNRMRQQYRNSLSAEDRALLDAEIMSRQTPLERRYLADRQAIESSGYWQIADMEFRLAQTRYPWLRQFRSYAELDAAATMPTPQAQMLREQRGYKQLVAAIRARNQEFRKRRPDIWALLLRWGYLLPSEAAEEAGVLQGALLR